MPTNNPVPSRDPSDLPFNAEKLDQVVNSPALTYTDRKGVVRKTLAGILDLATTAINAAVYSLASVNNRGAWATATAYAVKDLVQQGGTWYVAVLPHTSAAAFATDQATKWRVYQGLIAGDLSATNGAGLVGWIRNAVGAVAATQADWLGWRSVSPLEFMTTAQRADVTSGTLILDHTAAVQAAINTGKTVDLLGYHYNVQGLTQNTNYQSIVSSGGIAFLIKNANGPLLTSTADEFTMENSTWRGNGVFTGHGVVATGNRPAFINCGGRGITGRVLKATGGRVRVKGTCDGYVTSDATASGYDIEIGVSGTATLYHELDEIYSSQATGGILLVDTGTHTLKGGQIGQLTIQAGTKPAGVNGGKTIGTRILGHVLVEQSGATFAGVHFGAVTVTLALGTSGCSIDASNILQAGGTIVNNGSANSVIIRGTSAGSTMDLSYGPSSWTNTTKHYSTGKNEYLGDQVVPNNSGFKGKDTGGIERVLARLNSSDSFQLGDNVGAGFTNVAGGSGGVYLVVAGNSIVQATASSFRPQTDNDKSLGTSSQRWSTVYAGTGAINTSDARQKQQVRELYEAERAVAVRIKGLIRAFKFNDAVVRKGDGARIHFGVVAQDVAAAFEAEGLDPSMYALFCYDEWDDIDEVVTHTDAADEVRDEEGNTIVPSQPATTMVVQQYIPAGNRYGVRYEELLAFVVAAL